MVANLHPDELKRLVDEAAERGATRALERVGLHDSGAGADIRDLRNLINDWRAVKRGALGAIGRALGIALLGAIAATVAGQLWK